MNVTTNAILVAMVMISVTKRVGVFTPRPGKNACQNFSFKGAQIFLYWYNDHKTIFAHNRGDMHCIKSHIHFQVSPSTSEIFKGALDKFNIIHNFFPKKVGIFIPLEVLAWAKTACQVLRSRLTYFWGNMNISSIFYFPKSTSINTQYSSLWGTLKMMLFTKYLIKWKRIGRISWNFRYWFDLKSSIELDIKW